MPDCKKIFPVLLLMVLMVVFCPAKAGFGEESAVKIGPEVGNVALDFTLADLAGQPFSLWDSRGRVVFLNFWATWCPPCQSEVSSIEKIKNFFSPKDLQVVTVSLDSSAERLKKFIKEKNITFLVLQGSEGLSRLYLIRGIPTTLVINKKGVVVRRSAGARDWAAADQIKYFKNLIKEK